MESESSARSTAESGVNVTEGTRCNRLPLLLTELAEAVRAVDPDRLYSFLKDEPHAWEAEQ